MVSVDSDLIAPEEIDAVAVTLFGPDGSSLDSTELALGEADDLPFSFGVAPRDGDVTRAVHIRAIGLRAGRQVVSTELSTSFLAGEVRRVEMFLARACIGVACEPPLTCRAGECLPIDPSLDGGVRDSGVRDLMDAGVDAASTDSGPMDATIDAGPDATVDGGAGRPCPLCVRTSACLGPREVESGSLIIASSDVSGANIRLGQALSTERGLAVPWSATSSSAVQPVAGASGITFLLRASAQTTVTLDTRAMIESPMWPVMGSTGSSLVFVSTLDSYASAWTVDLTTLGFTPLSPIDVSGAINSPPSLGTSGDGFLGLTATTSLLRLQELDASLREASFTNVVSEGARHPVLTATCDGNWLATWWTTAGTRSAAIIGDALQAPLFEGSRARILHHRAANYDGMRVVTVGTDEVLEYCADGTLSQVTPVPHALVAFGTAEGLLVLTEYDDNGLPPDSAAVYLIQRGSGTVIREVARFAHWGEDAAVAMHTGADGVPRVYFTLATGSSRNWLYWRTIACQ